MAKKKIEIPEELIEAFHFGDFSNYELATLEEHHKLLGEAIAEYPTSLADDATRKERENLRGMRFAIEAEMQRTKRKPVKAKPKTEALSGLEEVTKGDLA